jgi:hypothetical protein
VSVWGISYGTNIGQYLVKILLPSRVGRVIIDSVVDSAALNDDPSKIVEGTISCRCVHKLANHPIVVIGSMMDFDKIVEGFANTCVAAGPNCTLNTLNFTSGSDIILKLAATMDALYAEPAPIFDLPYQAMATSADLRYALGVAMYSIANWPTIAAALTQAFQGNWTAIVEMASVAVSPTDAVAPDDSLYSESVIWASLAHSCACCPFIAHL